jgi:hypothetical protein
VSDPLGAFLEGLTGGFQTGYGVRTDRDERRRRHVTEDENRGYERARRLREDVGFQLQQRVREGELRRNDMLYRQTEERGRSIADAAMRIRQQFGDDPRFKGLTLLPDEDLVREFGDRVGTPGGGASDLLYNEPGQPVGLINRGTAELRPVTSGGKPLIRPRHTAAEQRQDLATVERQVDDTRADLARTEREVPTRPMFFLSPQDSTRFVADSAEVGRRLGGLRERADSLSVVRDSLAAEVQGRQFRRPGRMTPADRWEELVNSGVAPAEATRRVKQEFRLP